MKSIVSPKSIDNRNLIVSVKNQDKSPMCTAYASSSFVESIMWKKTGEQTIIDPYDIYVKTKEIDNIKSEGSKIEYALESCKLLYPEFLTGSMCRVSFDNIKRYIHMCDFVIATFVMESNWNKVSTRTGKIRKGISTQLGSHAVLICGYNEDGVYILNSKGEKYGLNGFCVLNWEDCKREFRYGVTIV